MTKRSKTRAAMCRALRHEARQAESNPHESGLFDPGDGKVVDPAAVANEIESLARMVEMAYRAGQAEGYGTPWEASGAHRILMEGPRR